MCVCVCGVPCVSACPSALIILLLSGLLTHCRAVSHCLVCRTTVEQFLIVRAISHSFAQFPGVSIHTPIIVWTVESWVFCVWIVWFILPRPQPGLRTAS